LVVCGGIEDVKVCTIIAGWVPMDVEIVVTMVIVTPEITVIPPEADPVAPATFVLVTVTTCPATVVVLDGLKLVCAATVTTDDNGEVVAFVTELVMFGRMTPTPP